MMPEVQIEPRYQELLRRRGLTTAADFLQLPGVILCGHADRHVLQIDDASIPFGLFLKKEHRVPWRERFASFFAGFGMVSRSSREAKQLELLRQADIGCPEVVAVGEWRKNAFLLLREQPGSDLRAYLSQNVAPGQRRECARALGTSLAKMHAAGFVHPDLYAKHVLVRRDGKLHISFLDWQRSRPPHPLNWRERLGNLAALDASLAPSLANDVDRLVCLRAYLRELSRRQALAAGPAVIALRVALDQRGHVKLPQPKGAEEYSLRNVLPLLRGLSEPLQKKTRLRELHQVPLPRGQQNLIWLDGERLCITQQLRQQHAGDLPEILDLLRRPYRAAREETYLNASTLLRLVKERTHGLGRWLRCKVSGRTYASPAFAQAALTFRLERHGLTPPRILALGQRFVRPWRSESFLLTEEPAPTVPLQEFLLEASARERWQVLRQTGILIHRLHQAGCRLTDLAPLGVQVSQTTPCVILRTAVGLQRGKRGFRRDLVKIWKSLKACCTQTDLLRFLLAYQGQPERFTRSAPSRTTHDVSTRKVPA